MLPGRHGIPVGYLNGGQLAARSNAATKAALNACPAACAICSANGANGVGGKWRTPRAHTQTDRVGGASAFALRWIAYRTATSLEDIP